MMPRNLVIVYALALGLAGCSAATNPSGSTGSAPAATRHAPELAHPPLPAPPPRLDAAPPDAQVTRVRSDLPPAGMHRFASAAYDFRIDYPATWTAQRSFKRSYMNNGAWKTYAPPKSNGTPVLDLIVPGSNQVTAAELRIGVSAGAAEVHRCTTPPMATRAASVGHRDVSGVRFVTFRAADAAMSHYLRVHSYRALRNGRCYAIDLLITGTNPQVYDPPRTPPFTAKQAFAQLERVLTQFHFTTTAPGEP